MKEKKQLSKDVVQKVFWNNEENFAAMCNLALFGGKKVVTPEMLSEKDGDVSQFVPFKDGGETLKRTRDVIKHVKLGFDVMIVGIENQTEVDYSMPFRVLLYDSLGYLEQIRAIVEQEKQQSTATTRGEFFSKYTKSSKLVPIISIVIYYGKDAWDGPRTFHDMLKTIDSNIKQYTPNLKLNLVEVFGEMEYTIYDSEVKKMFEVFRASQKSSAELSEEMKQMVVSGQLANMLCCVLGEEGDFNQYNDEKEETEMCVLFEDLKRIGREEGEARGEAKGARAIINLLLNMNMSIEKIREQLITQMEITEAEASRYLEMFLPEGKLQK